MRHFLMIAAFLLLAGVASAQSASGHNATNSYGCSLAPGDILSPCHGNGLGNNPWPMNLVTDVLKEAKPFFAAEQGLSLGQLIQAYHDCRCVITYLGDGLFRVQVGGGPIILIIISDF